MKTTKALSGFSELRLHSLSSKYSIEIPRGYQFSNINIVIGPNGAGKTRFLNLIKEVYSKNDNSIMYGYFPSLSDKKINNDSDEEVDYTLFDTLTVSETAFEDFLKAIETYNDDFMFDLLQYLKHRARVNKDRSKKALKTITDFFYELTKKQLVVENGQVVVKTYEKIENLSEALQYFSPGELMLFYMSLFMALQANNNKDKVIILDEPECHLHPKALIKFVKTLCERTDHSSVWIATHSLFLVPEFDFENIIYIDDGKIVPRNSLIYSNIMSGLLGEQEEKISEFFSSLSQWQFCNYIVECFTDPEVIDKVDPKDEQVQLFIKFLNTSKPYNVLDFGGGSARLGLSLRMALKDSFDNYSYDIYDPKPKYSGKDFKVYRNIEDIHEKYDCVVMMNVLHEIEPIKWVGVFNDIWGVLKENGYLMFVETSVLSKGESPHKAGFLVLDEKELQVLFNQATLFPKITLKESQKSVCILIKRSALTKISALTVDKAINLLEEKSLEKIKSIRKNSEKKDNVRTYAFYSQLYINAKMYNDSVKEKGKGRSPREKRRQGIKNYTPLVEIKQEREYIKSVLSEDLRRYDVSIRSAVMTVDIIIEEMEKMRVPNEVVKENLWNLILIMENKHHPKSIIVSLLRVNALANHQKSKEHLKNEYANVV